MTWNGGLLWDTAPEQTDKVSIALYSAVVDKIQKFLTLWLCYHPETRLEGTDSTDLQEGVAFRPLVDTTTYIKECQGKPLWLHADEFLFVVKVVTVLC